MSEEDDGGSVPPKEDVARFSEDVERFGGERDDGSTLRSDGMRDAARAWAADMFGTGESSEGPTWSSAPSTSASMALSAYWSDELPGSNACVPRG